MDVTAQVIDRQDNQSRELRDQPIGTWSEKNIEFETTSISMESFESEFESEKELYSRGESKIKLVASSSREQPIVVKQTPKFQKKNSQSFHQIHEVEFSRILQNLPQNNLISVYQINLTEDNLQVGMEFACGGNLTQYVLSTMNFITKFDKLNHLKTVKSILWKVVLGMEQIHRLGYVHRDIKPDNILITHSGQVKICDFQLVGPIGIIDDSFCGTPEYMPPERLTDKRSNCTLDASIDMWGLGVLAYEMLMGYVPFQLEQDNINELVDSMYGGYIYFDEDYPSYCKHFIFNLLQTNPRKRMTIQKLKKHQFFTTDFQFKDLHGQKCSCNKRN